MPLNRIDANKTEGHYLFFQKVAPLKSKKITSDFLVCNKTTGEILGYIMWHGPWRKYCYQQTKDKQIIYDHTCLKEISEFCELETWLHFRKKKQKIPE